MSNIRGDGTGTTPYALEKCPTGIPGFDDITNGGLPRNRTSLVCGGSGSGKTLFGMEFLVKGAIEHAEPGLFVCFEESAVELTRNVASLGYDLDDLARRKLLSIDHVHIERGEIEESGEYNLDGLFVRLGYAIDSIGAKRVVLDTIEALFAALTNEAILRAELRRLFRWLKDRSVTAIVTGERGDGTLTRHGLEEYVSDCVIALDQRVSDQIATRRLRVVKYRGSAHGTNEYPFLLDEQGFTVVPLTSVALQYEVSTDTVSTGVAKLDGMLGGRGYYRGGSLLVSGTAGSGKSSLAAHFVDAACRRGERAMVFAYEESPAQIIRNMRSIGIDLQPWLDQGLLEIHSIRPASFGLEMHLAEVMRGIGQFAPDVVVFDPISSFEAAGSPLDARAMLMRLVDFLKTRHATALFTSLTSGGSPSETSEVGISSLIDTWLLLRNLEQRGERTRLLYVLKARGMAHSTQVREFVIGPKGVDLAEVYMGPDGILTGSAKEEQALRDAAQAAFRDRDSDRLRVLLDHKRRALNARIAELETGFEVERRELESAIDDARGAAQTLLDARAASARQREAEGTGVSTNGGAR